MGKAADVMNASKLTPSGNRKVYVCFSSFMKQKETKEQNWLPNLTKSCLTVCDFTGILKELELLYCKL